MAERTEKAEEEYELTNADWGKVHAEAWRYPDFRTKLEKDPTEAIRDYVKKYHPGRSLKSLKIVRLRPAPDDIPEDFWDDVNPFPPSCC